MSHQCKRDLLSVGFLIAVSTLLGLLLNVVRSPSLPLLQPLPTLFPGEVSLQDAHRLLEADEGVFWDVRTDGAFQRVHILGALSPKNTPQQGDKTVVVYCSGRLCPKAQDAAERLRSQGFQDVRVMPDGIKGWKSAGYPLQRGHR